MNNLNQIRKTIELDSDLKVITSSYTEIAVIKMRRIRAGILQNRTFFNEINLLYQTVKEIANQKGVSLNQKSKGRLSLIISSNNHFYGSIERPVIGYFLKSADSDKIVVGRSAQEYLKNINPTLKFTPISLAKDIPTPQELKNFGELFKGYAEVFIFYSKMISPFKNQAQILKLSENTSKDSLIDQRVGFILEPEIKGMLEFFNSQIMISILYQSFLEAELSRTAGRLIAMDEANQKTEKVLKNDYQLMSQISKMENDIKLLDMLASLKGKINGI